VVSCTSHHSFGELIELILLLSIFNWYGLSEVHQGSTHIYLCFQNTVALHNFIIYLVRQCATEDIDLFIPMSLGTSNATL